MDVKSGNASKSKAVVASPAGAASAGPLFGKIYYLPCHFFAISAASVVLACDLIPSNHQKCRILLIRLSLPQVVARVINRHSQGVRTICPGVTAVQNNAIIIMTPARLIKVAIVKGLF